MTLYNSFADFVSAGRATFERDSPALMMDGGGAWQEFAAGHLRRVEGVGAFLEPARTNKCANFNANPTDLTGISTSGAVPPTITIVDRPDLIAAAGLSEICDSGKVYRAEFGNNAGVVSINGATGNTNVHTMSAWIFFESSSTGALFFFSGANEGVSLPLNSGLARISRTFTPQSAGATFGLRQASGGGNSVAYFLLNQLEQASSPSTPVVVAGSAATREADELSLNTGIAGDFDWKIRYGDDSEETLAAAHSGAFSLDLGDLNRPDVKRIWAEATA